jgi:UDP-glucose 4-epimerase
MYVAQGCLTATSLRIGNPYGVLLPLERMQGLIGVALNQIFHHQPVKIYGNPNNVRDYIHLEDMCRIFELAIDNQSGFQVYNVGSGQGYSVNNILDLLEQIAGYPVVRSIQPPTQITNYLPSWIVLDITKAREILRWQPEIAFEQGLKILCEQVKWNP